MDINRLLARRAKRFVIPEDLGVRQSSGAFG